MLEGKKSTSRPKWALAFSIFKSLTEGGIGGRVKEKVKPNSKNGLILKALLPPDLTWGLLFLV